MNKRMLDAINTSPKSSYTQIPNEIIRSPHMSGKAKTILCILLSNSEGWTSYTETIISMMLEGRDAVYAGLRELEGQGYLKRIQYVKKDTKQIAGLLWSYTNEAWKHNWKQILLALEDRGCEIQGEKPVPENPEAGYPLQRRLIERKESKEQTATEFKDVNYDITNDNNSINPTKSKRTITPTEQHTPTAKERALKYLPLAQKLYEIVKPITGRVHSNHEIVGWADQIRLLHEKDMDGNADENLTKIKKVMNWYSRHVGEQYVNQSFSGVAFREDFALLKIKMEKDTTTKVKNTPIEKSEKPTISERLEGAKFQQFVEKEELSFDDKEAIREEFKRRYVNKTGALPNKSRMASLEEALLENDFTDVEDYL